MLRRDRVNSKLDGYHSELVERQPRVVEVDRGLQ